MPNSQVSEADKLWAIIISSYQCPFHQLQFLDRHYFLGCLESFCHLTADSERLYQDSDKWNCSSFLELVWNWMQLLCRFSMASEMWCECCLFPFLYRSFECAVGSRRLFDSLCLSVPTIAAMIKLCYRQSCQRLSKQLTNSCLIELSWMLCFVSPKYAVEFQHHWGSPLSSHLWWFLQMVVRSMFVSKHSINYGRQNHFCQVKECCRF